MTDTTIPVPHLTTVAKGSLNPVEKQILAERAKVEAWFDEQWQRTPASITSSVDLRNAGFKLAPVDTNLFPAGFNNLNPEFMPLCVEAVQLAIKEYADCKNILILPESHTRNQFYMQSLMTLQTIFIKAGFNVRIGSLDPTVTAPFVVHLETGESLTIEPLIRIGSKLKLADFDPCLLILNNDLSTGMPEILEGIEQRIRPAASLGWSSRLKSSHFSFYDKVVDEFSSLIASDSWLINCYFKAVDGIDFMAQDGIERLAHTVDELLQRTQVQYKKHQIQETPFVAVKADNGTYGMSVMMVQDAAQILALNRKQRTRMSAIKGSQKVDRVIIQEGVFSRETMPNGSVAEPVIYMMGSSVVGGFYRVHQDKASNENLNAPGMHFEPLAFVQSCKLPQCSSELFESTYRFYAYGVVARLAALAAAREIAAVGGQ